MTAADSALALIDEVSEISSERTRAETLAKAQVLATLALAEEQRTANLIAWISAAAESTSASNADDPFDAMVLKAGGQVLRSLDLLP